VILDRSASVWESKDAKDGTRDWVKTLQFFQQLLKDDDIKVSKDDTLFSFATFSEDYVIHFGFNASYDKSDLSRRVQYNSSEDGSETWIPHDVVGGKDLRFAQTNFGLINDILRDAYENEAHGARPDAVPLVFLITDGSMDDQCSAVYEKNNCPGAGNSYTCGFDKRNDASFDRELCKTCWRNELAREFDATKVGQLAGKVNVIGIGNPANKFNRPDNRTLNIFAQHDSDSLIEYPDYQDLLDFARVLTRERGPASIKAQSCNPPPSAASTEATTSANHDAATAATTATTAAAADDATTPTTTTTTPARSSPATETGVCSGKDDAAVCEFLGVGNCDAATAAYPLIVPKVKYTCPGMCNTCGPRPQQDANLDAVLTEDEIALLSIARGARDCAKDEWCKLCGGQGLFAVPSVAVPSAGVGACVGACVGAPAVPRPELGSPAYQLS